MATKRVVAGVDGSEESMLAAEWAAMEAVRHGLPLRIVSAPGTTPRTPGRHASPATIAAELRDASARALGMAVTRAGEVAPGLAIAADMVSGPPALAVTGSDAGAVMLVVGARGAGGFAALALGSVSRYAADHADCPVIVVRQDTMAVHQAVVVGVHDPEDASAALTFAFEEAVVRRARLIVVHAWNRLASPLGGRPDSDETAPGPVPAGTARGLSAAVALWRHKYPGVRVERIVVGGYPAHVLADYSSRADLVVIGRHDRLGVGSTRHALLNHAHGPVAVVPSGGE